MTNAPSARNRRAFVMLAASALALGGCSDLLGPPGAAQIYIVRPEFPAPAALPATLDWTLSIERPSAPSALNSERIAIAQPDATMDYYANAQYPDPLPILVQTALLNAFERNGSLKGVARNIDALHADYDLLVDIKDFQSHYAVADGVPQAMVTLTARLVTSHGRNVAGTMTVSQTAQAAANSVGAATAALQQALTAASLAIVAWTLTFPTPPSQAVVTR